MDGYRRTDSRMIPKPIISSPHRCHDIASFLKILHLFRPKQQAVVAFSLLMCKREKGDVNKHTSRAQRRCMSKEPMAGGGGLWWLAAASKQNALRMDGVSVCYMSSSARHRLFLSGLHNVRMSILFCSVFTQVSVAWAAFQLRLPLCKQCLSIRQNGFIGLAFFVLFFSSCVTRDSLNSNKGSLFNRLIWS